MKGTFYLACASAVVALAAACSVDNLEPVQQEKQGIPMTLNVSIGDMTKATYSDPSDGTLKVEWEAGDKISVISYSSDNTSGTALTCDVFETSEGGASAKFTGTYTGAEDAPLVRVVYPALTQTGTYKDYGDNDRAGWSSSPLEYSHGFPVFGVSSDGNFQHFNFLYTYQKSSGDASHLEDYDYMSAVVEDLGNISEVTLQKSTSVLRLVLNLSSLLAGMDASNCLLDKLTVSLDDEKGFGTAGWSYSTQSIYYHSNQGDYASIYLGRPNGISLTDFVGGGDAGKIVLYIPVTAFAEANTVPDRITLKKDATLKILLEGKVNGGNASWSKSIKLKNDIDIPVGSCFTMKATFIEEGNINFKDDSVEMLCYLKGGWDTNGDEKISYAEAAAVKALGDTFEELKEELEYFDELQYFTGLTSIEERAFARFEKLKSIVLPNTVTKIGISSFEFTALSSISIPDSVEEIEVGAFYGCSALSSIHFGNGVKVIRATAFSGCSSLTSVVFPNSLESLEALAFSGCTGLSSVTVKATTPPAWSWRALPENDGLSIFVPAGSVEAYKTAKGWSDYADKIKPIE